MKGVHSPMKLLLITNYQALSAKYEGNIKTLLEKVLDILDADATRNVISTLAYVDNPVGVTDPADPRQNKAAIDTLYQKYHPDYMVLLGAGDIIPFQPLTDPVPPTQPGKESPILSDLPYACDASFSTEVTNFLAPTRKVTRLCDVQGVLTQDGLDTFIRTLHYASHITPSSVERYKDWWNVCTTKRLSPMYAVEDYFRSQQIRFNIRACPPYGPDWDKDAFSPMVHHHILHGGKGKNNLYGESNDPKPVYPVAIKGEALVDQPREGMVLLENACYGGQLYHQNNKELMPLANIYLASGGIVFASSSSTYSSTGRDMHFSDYLMSYFMTLILKGYDTGTALLYARQQLLKNARKYLSYPVLLKTLAEFGVYAHATVRPVNKTTSTGNIEHQKEQEPELPRPKVRLSKESPSKHVQKFIADFLFSEGIRFDPASPPSIWRCTAQSEQDDTMSSAEQVKECTYVTTVISETGETTVYTFAEQDGALVPIDKCTAN